jgi:C1A family cysteine protease
MAQFEPSGLGWLPSLPDFRDYTPETAPADELLSQLGEAGGGDAGRPSAVDLREYFLDADDQLSLNSSSAHACASLVEYFERRAKGRLLRPSRLFLYQNALRLAGVRGDCGAELRTTLKAMVLCGVPPERCWPYEVERFSQAPDAFLYSFDEPYRGVRYLRLDGRKASGSETLRYVKAFLAAGFPAAFGFPVPNSLSAAPDIPYRPTFDAIVGGQAVIAVGYDDLWLRGSRGALLVRSSWSSAWGDNGYGWLPYSFVEEKFAIDFWTLLHPDWIASGEFDLPDLS